jgi:parallel beta-helix repeat protein
MKRKPNSSKKSQAVLFLIATSCMICVMASPIVAMPQYSKNSVEKIGAPEQSLSDRVIYVDDDAPPGGDGSLEHPYNYLFDGLDAAGSGDTVFVFSGTYPVNYAEEHRNLVLDKPGMKLIGEDKETTSIIVYSFWSLELMTITADNNEVRGFTIRTDEVPGWYEPPDSWSAIIGVYSDHNIISNVNIYLFVARSEETWSLYGKANHGILLDEGASHNVVTRNNIPEWIWDAGIAVKDQSNTNIISNNIVKNDGYLDSQTFFHQNQGIYLEDSEGNIVFGNEITCGYWLYHSLDFGIYLENTADTIIVENDISETGYGSIEVMSASSNTIIANMLENMYWAGIFCYDSEDNRVMRNTIINNYESGLKFVEASNNTIYHNNFIDNTPNAWDESSNTWDDGYPSGGNYWSDYTGSDEYNGPEQNIPGSDGIGDTPYAVPGGDNQDTYPFMSINGWPNTPPNTPTDPIPGDGAQNIALDPEVSWNATDSDSDDFLCYAVYFGSENPPPLVSVDQVESYYNPGQLDYNTVYYWKVIARDTMDQTTVSPVWEFRTEQEPDSTPPTGSISKPDYALYVRNNRVMNLFVPVIIGSIDIEVDAADEQSGINRVEFYLNDEYVGETSDEPYSWHWDQPVFLKRHQFLMKIQIYDNANNTAIDELAVYKFF